MHFKRLVSIVGFVYVLLALTIAETLTFRKIVEEDMAIGSGTYTSPSGKTTGKTKINAGSFTFPNPDVNTKTPADWSDRGWDTPIYPSTIVSRGTERNILVYDTDNDGAISGSELTAGIADIGATQLTLIIDVAVTNTGVDTFPATTTLRFVSPGKFIDGGSGSLTINGRIIAEDYLIFSGFATNDVNFGTNVFEIEIGWWKSDVGLSDDATAFQSAIDAASANSTIKIPRAVWLESGVTFTTAGLRFKGLGVGKSVISLRDGTWTSGEPAIKGGTTGAAGTSVDETVMEDLEIDGTNLTAGSHSNVVGIQVWSSSDCRYKGLKITNTTGHALHLEEKKEYSAMDNVLRDLYLGDQQSGGLGKALYLKSDFGEKSNRRTYIENVVLRGERDETQLYLHESTVIDLDVVAGTGIGITVSYGGFNYFGNLKVLQNQAGASIGLEVAHAAQGTVYEGCKIILDSDQGNAISHTGNADNCDIIFSGCYIETNRGGVDMGTVGGTTSKRITLDGCELIRKDGGTDVFFDLTSGGRPDILIQDCYFNASDSTDTFTILGIHTSDRSRIVNNTFIGNNTTTLISINSATGIKLDGNVVRNHATGFSFATAGATSTAITNNLISSVTTPIGGNSTSIAASLIRNNVGFVTENKGASIIANGTTSVVVTHGLDITPIAADISLVAEENATNDIGYMYVNTMTATQFTVHCVSDPGASNLGFAWKAQIF